MMNALLLFGFPGGSEWLIILLAFGVFGFAFLLPLVAIIDAVRSEFKGQNDKLIWILVILLFPFFGSFIYLIVGRDQKIQKSI